MSLLYSLKQTFARIGCCSHHGGVCGCGCCDGSGLSSTCAPYYPECSGGGSTLGEQTTIELVSTPIPVRPTARPTSKPVVKPTSKPTLKPSTPPATCSAVSDNVCSKTCTAGNDSDCCANVSGYQWYDDWGCYPEKLTCSAKVDGICDAYCSAGNDADCCTQRLSGYQWFDNWGCYPKQ